MKPLITLYGEDAIQQASLLIQNQSKVLTDDFKNFVMKVLNEEAVNIIEGKSYWSSLSDLVVKSYEEAKAQAIEINPLIKLYGRDALEKTANFISELSRNSNIPFSQEYAKLGYQFMMIKAKEVLEGKRENSSLQSLVTSSFGEAAIATYNT